jgi:peptide/nickel transport system substrate-binding protein
MMQTIGRSLKSLPLLYIFLIILTASGCVSNQPTQSTEGSNPSSLETPSRELERDTKTLVVAIYGTPTDFDPATNNESLGNLLLYATTEGLVRVDPQNINQFKPQLAERWESNEDYTVWTFYLRENARFHDGTPVDAQAVKLSFARLINSQSNYSFILAQFIDDPDIQMVVKGQHILEFRFDRPTPLLLKALSSSYGSYVISPTAVQQHDKNGDMAHEWLQTHEAGSGPYILSELSPNQQAILTRFEDWWGWDDGWHFDKVLLRIVPERSSRRSLIEKGDVDIAFDFGAEDWEALKKNSNVVVHLSDGLTVQYIALGKYGPLEDPRVRQAISYAFDYNGYVNGIWKGHVPRANGVFARRLLCHDPNVFMYETNLEKARQLLEEAGIQEGLELRYLTTGDRQEAIAGQILQAQLAKIGINLKIEQREIVSFVSLVFSDVKWPERPELMGFTWWPDYNDPTNWTRVLFHSDAAGSMGGNIGLYGNERVDEIIDQGNGILDEDELCEIYREFQDIVVRQDPAWIPLVELPNEVVLRSDISGYQNNPAYHNTFDFHQLFRIDY